MNIHTANYVAENRGSACVFALIGDASLSSIVEVNSLFRSNLHSHKLARLCVRVPLLLAPVFPPLRPLRTTDGDADASVVEKFLSRGVNFSHTF